MRTIEDIRTAAAKARASAEQAISPEQAERIEALAEEREALEAAAAAAAKLRGLDLADREEKARAAAAGAYLVQGVDLVGLHPFGAAPPVESLPAGGVIVIRSPDMETSDAFVANAETMKQGLSALAIKLVCGCVVDPKDTATTPSADGVKLLGYLQKFPEAAGTIALRAKELGGQQAKVTKRGRG